MTVSTNEFLGRFMLHVLPKGFVRIRFFGFMANRRRAAQLLQCQQLLLAAPVASPTLPARPTTIAAWTCPVCGGTMMLVERLTGATLIPRSRHPVTANTVRQHRLARYAHRCKLHLFNL